MCLRLACVSRRRLTRLVSLTKHGEARPCRPARRGGSGPRRPRVARCRRSRRLDGALAERELDDARVRRSGHAELDDVSGTEAFLMQLGEKLLC